MNISIIYYYDIYYIYHEYICEGYDVNAKNNRYGINTINNILDKGIDRENDKDIDGKYYFC